MKEYSVSNLKLLVNGECINLGCFVDFIKDKPINMEHYIASYKHLIGCEAEFNNSPIICFRNREFEYLFKSSPKYVLKNLKFYLDDESLGTYEEYMQLHYPEYVHVWKHQL